MTVSHTNSVLRLAYTTVSTASNCHIQLGPESVKTLTETLLATSPQQPGNPCFLDL